MTETDGKLMRLILFYIYDNKKHILFVNFELKVSAQNFKGGIYFKSELTLETFERFSLEFNLNPEFCDFVITPISELNPK